MEVEIWRNFPEDLYEIVLAKLPVATIVRFRLVCKNWNSLLTDKTSGIRFPVPQHAQHPLFYTLYVTDDVRAFCITMYDPCSNRWYHPTFPYLPTKPTKTGRLSIVGSVRGLVCILDPGDGYHNKFYVCDPISRSFKVLPEMDTVWELRHTGMVLDKTAGVEDGFIIIVRGIDFFCFYISRDNSWTPLKRIPTDEIQRRSFVWGDESPHTVYVDGTLYYMRLEKPEVIVSCHVETWVWKQTRVPLPTVNLVTYEMTAYQGKIMLMGLERKEDVSTTAARVWIWELQKMGTLPWFWKEVDHSVDMDLSGMDSSSLVKSWFMNCFSGNNVDLTMWKSQSGADERHVIYNFRTNEWWLDIPTLAQHPRKCGKQFKPFKNSVLPIQSDYHINPYLFNGSNAAP